MAVGYEIRINGGSPIDVGADLHYMASGLTNDTDYDVEVRSYDDVGNRSTWSAPITVHTTNSIAPSEITSGNVGGYWDAKLGTINGSSVAAAIDDTVATWHSQINGVDGTEATDGNRPVLILSDYCNERALEFVAKQLTMSTFTGFASLTAQCWMFVFRPNRHPYITLLTWLSSGTAMDITLIDNDHAQIYSDSNATVMNSPPGVIGTGGHIFTFVWDGSLTGNSNRWKIYIDGTLRAHAFISGSAPASSGAWTGFKVANADSLYANHELFAILHLKVAPDTATRQGLEEYFRNRFFSAIQPTYNVNCLGDSRTRNYASPANQAWPHKVAQSLGLNSLDPAGAYIGTFDYTKGTVINNGVNGQTVPIAVASASIARTAKYDAIRRKNFAVISWGINDLAVAGDTAATLETNIQAYCAAAKAEGYIVGITTLCPIVASVIDYATYLAEWTAYNTWLRANWAIFADFFVDPAADSRLTDPADAIYYTDGTHFTASGNQVMAELVLAQVTPLIYA